jgi:uncharacterized membrane protein
MLGIRGLDAFGAVHTMLGLVALICGAVVLLRAKGTGVHRRIGRVYVAAMTCLNVTGLLIYDLYGHFGPFHVAALVSLATVAAGYVAIYLRRPRASWIEVHAIFFCWSYVGLWAAFVSEVVVRVPGVSFNSGAIVGSVVAVAVGAILIHTRVPALAAKLRRHSAV